jgi:ubiquinone/menaquinone biosynthesis C-methylase UbiE
VSDQIEKSAPVPSATPAPGVADYWNAAAERYDEEVDHGLRDVDVREAWRHRLVDWLPPAPAAVLDLGCGTGSLALLMTELGHVVTGIDLAEEMVAQARAKCAGRTAAFRVGNAADPVLGGSGYDVVTARHLLWTLPDPEAALRRWIAATRPGGRLVLVEGRWQIPGDDGRPYVDGADAMPWAGGVRAEQLVAALDPLVDHLEVQCLSDDATLWGRPVEDERYAVVATVPAPPTP